MLFTFGVVVRSHYCMNKLASRHLFGAKAKHCNVCGMDIHSNRDCCNDELKVVKQFQDEQPIVTSQAMPDIPVVLLHDVSPSLSIADFNDVHVIRTGSHSPPLKSSPDIYLEIGVFRI
jgi:hypothetical protein